MYFVDTHTHLYDEAFEADRDKLISKAIHGGIHQFYLPNIDSSSVKPMLDLEASYPQHCQAMMGLHPCSVKENVEDELKIVYEWLGKRRFAAIGEIGLDLYWDKTFQAEQEKAFARQIEWALEFNYPIVIHCRNAFDEIIRLMKTFRSLPSGVFHCFSGNLQQAQEVLKLGQFKLGIGGVLTFKNAGLDKVVEQIDIQHLVLETDAPYLAPVPFRGKRNEPAYLLEVARKLASLKGMELDELAAATSANAEALFKKA
ncbi:MAG TPA: TatD family hydrolase [Bacteroidia bacterium]|nr:TatD family hydrolase [Bacteroidia bacterium]